MGFTGTFVVCRSTTPLDELAPIADRDEGLVWHDIRSSSWQLGQYLMGYLVEDSPAMLGELCDLTGCPALTGYVEDSDYVLVEGLSTSGRYWQAELIPSIKQDNAQPPTPTIDVLLHATAWSKEAGLNPDMSSLSLTLNGTTDSPLAEDLFLQLLEALGLSR